MFFNKNNNIFNIKSFLPNNNELIEKATYNQGALKIYGFNDFVVASVDLSKQYVENAIVRIVVDKIANTISNLEPMVMNLKTHKRDLEHELNILLKNPNREQIWSELVRDLICDEYIFGVYYLYAELLGKNILSLKRITPSSVSVDENDKLGNVLSYNITLGDTKKKFKNYPYSDPKSLLLKQTFYNPESSNFKDNGTSPLSAAKDAINHINSANKFNLSFIENGARPSVAYIIEPRDGYDGILTDEQRTILQKQLNESHVGSANAGRPILLEGGIKIQNLSSNMKDMDFSELMEISIQIICNLMGLPIEECQIGSRKTEYSLEAKKSFIMDTCIPIADKFYNKLNSFIMPKYDTTGDLILTYNRSNINLLMKDVLEVMVKAKETEVFTTNESRAINNMDAVQYGDEVRVGIGTAPLGTTMSKNFETVAQSKKEVNNKKEEE